MSKYKIPAEKLRTMPIESLTEVLRQTEIEIKRLDGQRGIGLLTKINPEKKKLSFDLRDARKFRELKKNKARMLTVLGERNE